MRVIDLLNKIANGEETHFDTKLNGKCVVVRYYNDRNFSSSTDPEMLTIADIIKSLNDEVEIIEEDKKIEKLEHMNSRDYLENRDEYLSTKDIALDIETLRHWINKIVDYLEENK